MQLFDEESIAPRDAEACASLVIETVPLVMRAIRREARRHHAADLSVAQFRTLMHIGRHRGASLSDLAAFHGLGLSASSRLVDGLVQRGLITREPSVEDRRRVTLALTDEGAQVLDRMHQATRAALAERVVALAAEEQAVVAQAMAILRRAFTPSDPRRGER